MGGLGYFNEFRYNLGGLRPTTTTHRENSQQTGASEGGGRQRKRLTDQIRARRRNDEFRIGRSIREAARLQNWRARSREQQHGALRTLLEERGGQKVKNPSANATDEG